MTHVLPRQRRRLLPRRLKRAVLLAVPGMFLLLVLAAVVAYVRTDVPQPDQLAVAGATRILYADGSELGRVGGQNRIPVELEKVPQHVRDAVLAAEDRGHYEDPGISPRGIARALFTNVRGGGDIQQGGSTITQQYAKNAFLSSERTYTRKVKEIFISLKMTREQSKDEILENYLNTIYFGRGAYGIQVASSTYFGKPVEQLTPAEAAVLAAVIRSPANYDPEKQPDRAQDRWRYVVNGMVETGALTTEEAGALQYPAVKPAAEADKNNDLSGPKGHVIRRVMDELERGLEARGQSQLLTTGLVVTTTLRREAQDAAVAAVQGVVGTPTDEQTAAPKGALVSVDPTSGGIVAYYGGSTGVGFDYAAQGTGRQPGSSFKPFVLAAALDNGISLKSTFDGNNRKRFPGVPEPIRNFGDNSYGRVSLREATQKSVNTAYFELGLEVGPKKVEDLAKGLGITTPLGNGSPEGGISLGIYDVRPQDQAVAYAAFANGGQRVTPHFIASVRYGEDEVYGNGAMLERVLDEDVTRDVTDALRDVVRRGTGTRARLDGNRPAAGKTGTTSDNFDVWFAGYTPQLSTAVWFGTGRNETLRLEGVGEATGGRVAAAAWKAYMDAASAGMPVEDFPPPANVGKALNGSLDDDDAPRTRRPQPVRTSESPEPAPTTTSPEPAPTTKQPGPKPKPTASEPTVGPTIEPTTEPTTEPPPDGGGQTAGSGGGKGG
ncbi:MAG TPA: transglycosylase domain-containing protein [Mycobacteriales bacterium]|nr:transglycosylase domain-containing protein [Mycobacteriales bacterium]